MTSKTLFLPKTNIDSPTTSNVFLTLTIDISHLEHSNLVCMSFLQTISLKSIQIDKVKQKVDYHRILQIQLGQNNIEKKCLIK